MRLALTALTVLVGATVPAYLTWRSLRRSIGLGIRHALRRDPDEIL